MRRNLFTSWTSHLQTASLQFRSDLARVEVCTLYFTTGYEIYLKIYMVTWSEIIHCGNTHILIGRCVCFSTCPMRMRGPDGLPIPCQLMTCVLRTPSCWRGSTGTPWSLTLRDRPQSSSWTSTRRRALKRPGQNLESALSVVYCTCTLYIMYWGVLVSFCAIILHCSSVCVWLNLILGKYIKYLGI